MAKVDNAVMIVAGTSSRFAPLSYEHPKGLTRVRGEVLIERQISQLRAAGIRDIYLVVGYMGDRFSYLQKKFGVHILENSQYAHRNNHGSIYAAREVLGNSYVCCGDNYFARNPFEPEVAGSYYATVFAQGPTQEWCVYTDKEDVINRVEIGGRDAWYMLGHTYWDRDFSRTFLDILEKVYDLPETRDKLWEGIYADHLDKLSMKRRCYPDGTIFEFDTLDELREFDPSYWEDSRSVILKDAAAQLGCQERELTRLRALRGSTNAAEGFSFCWQGKHYYYNYQERIVREG